jgi:hypothetical protein
MKGKTSKTDIGGLELVYPSIREKMKYDIYHNIHFAYYDKMVSYFGGKDKLPEVIDTKVDQVQPVTLKHPDGKKVPSYKMRVLVRYGENGIDYNVVHVTVGQYANVCWNIISLVEIKERNTT